MITFCLDPKELNKGIQREHYHLLTNDDGAANLPFMEQVLTVLDARSKFWHVVQ